MLKTAKSFFHDFYGALSVFFALSYVLIIVPKFLETAGMDYGTAFFAVALSSALGCFLSAVLIHKPLVFAPYISENSFLALFVTSFAAFSYLNLLACAFIAAVAAFFVFLINYRYNLIVQTPPVFRAVLPSVVGIFLVLTGALKVGILAKSSVFLGWGFGRVIYGEGVIIAVVLAALFGLRFFKIRHNVLISLALGMIAAFCTGAVKSFVYVLPVVKPMLFVPDFGEIFSLKYLPLIITFFVFLVNDISASTVAVLSYDSNSRANDEKKVMLVSSLASIFAPILGSVSSGIYPESILTFEHGKSGRRVSLILALLFAISIFALPFFEIIPLFICSSILIYVGVLLCLQANFKAISDFADVCCVLVLLFCIFATMNLALSVCAFFALYVPFKLVASKRKQVNLLTVLLCVLSILFLIFYPH